MNDRSSVGDAWFAFYERVEAAFPGSAVSVTVGRGPGDDVLRIQEVWIDGRDASDLDWSMLALIGAPVAPFAEVLRARVLSRRARLADLRDEATERRAKERTP